MNGAVYLLLVLVLCVGRLGLILRATYYVWTCVSVCSVVYNAEDTCIRKLAVPT